MFGDVFLHGEDVARDAVVLFAPEVPAGRDVDQRDRDPHPLARFAHASFENLRHAEARAGRARVAAELRGVERRFAREDVQPFDAREDVDDLVRQPFAEERLIAIRGHVRKREHGDARPRALGHGVADEEEAFAVHGADPRRRGRGIAEHLARVADHARDRRFGDVLPFPHLAQQLFLRDHAAAVRDEMGDRAEHFRLHAELPPGAQKLLPLDVELERAEADHVASFRWSAGGRTPESPHCHQD
ncbi:MAG TPA: hypothetical protein VF698_14325 [Thermoanaerobaculia bacterium]|jgi:ribosomal protein S18 acetylase RimI-like enzyme